VIRFIEAGGDLAIIGDPTIAQRAAMASWRGGTRSCLRQTCHRRYHPGRSAQAPPRIGVRHSASSSAVDLRLARDSRVGAVSSGTVSGMEA
jgi:hypothetical protein